LEEMYIFIQQGRIKLVKVDRKYIYNVSWAAEKQVISEGSCDTEDRSNAENTSLTSQE